METLHETVEQKCPWIKSVTPTGYDCTGEGVGKVSAGAGAEPELISLKPVWVTALSRDGARENWGRLVCWQDHDGELHERAIGAGRLHAHSNELAQELADAGLPVVPGRERDLMRYLAAFVPESRLIAATGTGWLGESFVLPQQVLGEPKGERIVFQPVTYHAAAEAIYIQGTLAEWSEHVAAPAADDSLQCFAISASLAAPLRFLTSIEAGGFHFYGTTTTGKTTLLQMAASVFGNSADPAQVGGDSTYLRRWNMTKNAMEGLAEAHNDLPLVVDEIGEGDEHDFGKLIYKVMGGTGRGRADRTGGARKHRHWRAWLLSAGEVPVSTYINEAGQKVRGGQLVRLIDLPANSIFPDSNTADLMKDACTNYFGTAGPAFVEAIINDDIDNVREQLKQLDQVAEHIGEAKTNEEKRVRKRFALAGFAGEMAINSGVLPWPQGRAMESTKTVFALWRQDNVAVSDAERGIANVVSFILKHGPSRFDREDGHMVRDRVGIYRDGYYHFFTEAFPEACGGVLPKTVKHALRDRELLHVSDAKSLRASLRVNGKSTHVVSVKGAIIESAPPAPTNDRDIGAPQNPIKPEAAPPAPPAPPGKHNVEVGVVAP